jgi:hypothetical protein
MKLRALPPTLERMTRFGSETVAPETLKVVVQKVGL